MLTTDLDEPPRDHDDSEEFLDVDREAPVIPWRDFIIPFSEHWEQGQHVGIIGPTDSGKTTLAFHLLPIHIYVCVLGTKPRDKNLDHIIGKPTGFIRKRMPPGKYIKLDEWKDMSHERFPRRIIWPNALDMDSDTNQRVVFHKALATMYREGGWTLYCDELWYLGEGALGLNKEIRVWLQQIRSNHGTIVVSSQRP